jgi:acyl-CoA thioesterase FadM
MTGIVSRWVVLQEHAVTADDVDANGDVLDEVVERWVDEACAAYLDHCRTLRDMERQDGLALRSRLSALPPGACLGQPTTVAVSAGAREVRSRSFTIAVRLRAAGCESDIAVNAACVVSLEDPATGEARELGEDVRDEQIALEHAAAHFN